MPTKRELMRLVAGCIVCSAAALRAAEPDVSLGADERPIGGLGIFLVRKTMDEVRYAYRDGQNVLSIRKKIR